MSQDYENPYRRLNFVISGWICIVFGTGVLLSGASSFSISIAAPISLGGVSALIYGLSLGGGGGGPAVPLRGEEE